MGGYIHFIWVLSRKILLVFLLRTVKQLKILYNVLFTEVIRSILNHEQRLLTEPARPHLKVHKWAMY